MVRRGSGGDFKGSGAYHPATVRVTHSQSKVSSRRNKEKMPNIERPFSIDFKIISVHGTRLQKTRTVEKRAIRDLFVGVNKCWPARMLQSKCWLSAERARGGF